MSLLAKWGRYTVPSDVRLGLAEEWIDPNEPKTFAMLAELLTQGIARKYASGPVLRDAHPKDHGCVRARLVVEPNLPPELRVGVFAKPREYPAWVRFSTGSGDVSSDANKEFMGMAIKLMDVPGEKLLEDETYEQTQDFLLISVGAMPIRNGVEFAKLVDAVSRGKPLSYFFNFSDPHFKEFLLASKNKRHNGNPLYLRYNSTVPYLFGAGRAVKYAVLPTFPFEEKLPPTLTSNYLREAMQEHLNTREARYDFMVQIQTDPVKMPVEDALVNWSEALSPLRKVATVILPPQDFNTVTRRNLAEHISYHPWHSLPEHRPLGHMNRARRVVYSAIARYRHERNGVPPKEPTPNEPY